MTSPNRSAAMSVHLRRAAAAALLVALAGAAHAQGAPPSVVITERYAAAQNLAFRGAVVDRDGTLVAASPVNTLGGTVLDYATATTVPFETSVLGVGQPIGAPTVSVPIGTRASVFEDLLVNTNLQNPSVSTGLQFGFADNAFVLGEVAGSSPAGLVNGPGVDLIVFELSPPAGVVPPSGGPTVLGGDPFQLVDAATGEALQVFAGDYAQFGFNGFTGSSSFFTAAGDPFGSLEELENGELAFITTVPGLNLYGAAVDLSDLGVAEGASVDALTFQSIAATGFGPDFGLIAGLTSSFAPPPIEDGALQLAAFGPFVEDFTIDVLTPQGGTPIFTSIDAPLFTTIAVDSSDPLVQSVTGDFLLDGGLALTPQARSVADAITVSLSVGPGASLFAALEGISDLGADGLDFNLRQLSPEPFATAPVVLAAEAADFQGRALRDRLERVSQHETREIGRTNFWTEGFGAFQDVEGDAGAGFDGFSPNLYGVSGGLDRWLSPNTLVGVFGSYTVGEADFDTLAAESDLDTVFVGGYGLYTQGVFHIGFGGAYGFGEGEVERGIVAANGVFEAESEYDADQIFGYIEAGARFGGDVAWLKPQLGLVFNNLESFFAVETGAGGFDLAVARPEDVNTLFVEPQLQVGTALEFGGLEIKPSATIGYRYEALGEETEVFAVLVDSPTLLSQFSADGALGGRSSVFGGAGVDVALGDRIALFGEYEGLGGGGFTSHEIAAGFRYSF